jgi:hypothetical protein
VRIKVMRLFNTYGTRISPMTVYGDGQPPARSAMSTTSSTA